jgi:hypothetical protein
VGLSESKSVPCKETIESQSKMKMINFYEVSISSYTSPKLFLITLMK